MGCSFKSIKQITITNAFQNIFNESKRKPNKGKIKAVNFAID